jgi:hypothetical protein
MPLSSQNPHGHPMRSGGARVALLAVTLAALKAIPATDAARTHGNEVMVEADGSRWYFHSSSALTGDDILVVAPSAGSGRWLRAPGTADLALPIAFGTADGATLLTVPAGCRMLVRRGYWEVTTAFAGGSSSAIGLAGPSPHNTAGDVLGGAGGDVEATLTEGVKLGTIGADQAVGILLKAADTVTFERITSAFTSGAGFAHLVVEILQNAGA